jgi:phosphatidylethanolamine/phosphatidyl-N-methylethanolamine N-methyltransferase
VSKESEIDSFYNSHYREIMGSGLIAKVWARIHRKMESPFGDGYYEKILELGAGNGEHIPFVKCDYAEYLASDLRIDNLANISRAESRIKTDVQDAQNLTLPDNCYDRVIVTCLLVHLDKPEDAISEIRRVTKKITGSVTIYLPCEPGIFLRLTRAFTTHLKARKRGVNDISRLHYLEHRNYYLAIDNLVMHEFSNSKVKKRYYPFPFLSWNFNLYRIYQISDVQ